MDTETRAYLDDMRREFQQGLRALGETLRVEMRQGDLETRNQLGALIEAQRHDLAAVAEDVIANRVSIDRLGRELRRELDERFEIVRLAFSQLRADVDERFETVRLVFSQVDERFETVRLALGQVRRDIGGLGSRRRRTARRLN